MKVPKVRNVAYDKQEEAPDETHVCSERLAMATIGIVVVSVIPPPYLGDFGELQGMLVTFDASDVSVGAWSTGGLRAWCRNGSGVQRQSRMMSTKGQEAV